MVIDCNPGYLHANDWNISVSIERCLSRLRSRYSIFVRCLSTLRLVGTGLLAIDTNCRLWAYGRISGGWGRVGYFNASETVRAYCFCVAFLPLDEAAFVIVSWSVGRAETLLGQINN